MIYKITLKDCQLSKANEKLIKEHLSKIEQFLPDMAEDLPLISIFLRKHKLISYPLKNPEINRNSGLVDYFEGTFALHLPNNPLYVQVQEPTIEDCLDKGFNTIFQELDKYKSTHFTSDSEYPEHVSIRNKPELFVPQKTISVYLGVEDKRTPTVPTLLTQFHSLINGNLSEGEQKAFKKDIERINDYLEQSYSKSNVRSLVFFSSGKKLWQVQEFEFYLPPLVTVSDLPNTKPLARTLPQYQKYLVLLVDLEKARIFTVHLGKIEEHLDVFDFGEVPQRVKAKKIDYGRDDKIFRHIEDHLFRHLEKVTDAAQEFAKSKEIHFVIIGGHREVLSKIKKHLKYPLNKMVLGEFVTELNIPLNQVFEHSKKIAEQVHKKGLHKDRR